MYFLYFKFALQKVKCHAFPYVVGPALITGAASSVRVSAKYRTFLVS